ncbi:arginine-glutamic acid dipeptide repeats protein-like [Lutzomyia longipalpis]|uniref:arginine-glutamic acid dipeptide repeats protein-like n=1 Tax=Lutzomyia longipalpis TaxID=7200 RepID=UPI0024836405|nr:arginine-glutamic acid dipeptide repeats protein-like [Lutzomyia longipalpis]
MILRVAFVVFLGTTMAQGATEKIQLEDIERDNLISEQRTKAANDGLEVQQTQHLRPPGIQPPNSFHSVIGGVTYATGQPHEPQATIEFVTLPPQYPAAPQPQVHEEDRTHSAPSRQSLLAPQPQHSVQASPQQRPQHTFAPQPQYVYVQAIPQAQKAPSQPQYQTTGQEVETSGQNQAQQTQQLQYISLPQRDVQTRAHPTAPAGYVSIPYNYGGMYAAPSAASYTYQPAQTQPAYILPTIQPHYHQNIIAGPTPTPGIQYAAAATAAPTISSPVAYVKNASPHSYVTATQVPFASYQHSYPQAIEYQAPVAATATSTKLLPVSQHHHTDYSSQFHPTLDFHGQSSNYHSLLDSYIPSSYIYARTKATYGQNYPLRSSYSHLAPTYLHHYRPQQFDTHGAHTFYNTIAYSADGVHHHYPSPSFTAKRAAIPGA